MRSPQVFFALRQKILSPDQVRENTLMFEENLIEV